MHRSAAHNSVDSVAVHRQPSVEFEALSLATERARDAWDTARAHFLNDPADEGTRQRVAESQAYYKRCTEALVECVLMRGRSAK